ISAFAWSQTAGSSVTLTDASSASATFTTPTLIAPEQLTFSLTVTDNLGATGTDTLTVMVNPVNAHPTAQAGADQVVLSTTNVTLSGTANDADGTVSSTLWRQTSGETVILTNADLATATFTAPTSAGLYVFELTATDNEGATATDTVMIDVQRFILNHDQGATDQFAANTYITFSVAGIDAEQHQLSWSHVSDTQLIMHTSSRSSITDSVEFFTLTVATDQNVTIKATVTADGITTALEKTITMLGQNPLGFASANVAKEVLVVEEDYQQVLSDDLTGDGYPDLLSIQNGVLSLLVNKGADAENTGDRYQTSTVITTANAVRQMYLADLNQDGLKDILLFSFTSSPSITWLANDNTHLFATENTLELPSDLSGITMQVADMDRDGDIDVVIHSPRGGVGWFEQTAPGTFTSLATLITSVSTRYVDGSYFRVADFNNDGANDIVMVTSTGDDMRPVWLFTNDGNMASFTQTTIFNMTGGNIYSSYNTRGLLSVDINQDSLPDLVIWQSGKSWGNPNGLSKYMINQGDGTFTEHPLAGRGSGYMHIMNADIDGDGDQDIVQGVNSTYFGCDLGATCYFYYPGTIFWQENVEGSFDYSVRHYLGYSDSAHGFTLSDVDKDGDLDVINADTTSGSILLRLNNTNPLP
ncbi:MAG: VCBS repeat-containing protein, partial [Algicola sp.]|nr:VCBS repeat-containing protein [Algicola sp.]